MKFRLVDKILGWSPYERITGIKAVSFEEYCLKKPFGDEARLPETLLLESFLQLGNWLILLSSDFARMGMVIRITEVRFDGYLLPGQQVRMEVAGNAERDPLSLRPVQDPGFVHREEQQLPRPQPGGETGMLRLASAMPQHPQRPVIEPVAADLVRPAHEAGR